MSVDRLVALLLLLLLLLPVLLSLPARAQEHPVQSSAEASSEARIEAVRRAYQQLDYEAARAAGQALLEDYAAFSPLQLAELHSLLGQVAYLLNEQPEARRHFEAALQLRPDLSLDPLLVSPKILSFFDAIRQRLAEQGTAAPEEAAAVRYLLLPDPRPAAALRSMVWPGWGQHYKGETGKGWVFTGLWTGTAAATGAAHLLRQRHRQRYLDETDPSRVAARYDTYDRWHKTRDALVWAAGAVWVASYVDALVHEVPASAPRRLQVMPAASPGQLQMTVRWRF